MNTLYKKSFLRLMDFTYNEIQSLLTLASTLKQQKHKKQEIPKLIGKNIVLIFEHHSTRTRCSFEVAAFDQGAHTTYLDQNVSQMGHKESIQDTAKILGKLYDGIQYRGYSQNVLQTFSEYSGIPVWNGLTSKFHPTQILADLMTIQEKKSKPFNQIKLAYIGDTHNNIANSLLEAAAITGLNLRLIAPKIFWPRKNFFSQCQKLAKKKDGNIILTENINEGIKNVDFLYTDVWVSMGENKKTWKEKISLLKNYQINISTIQKTNNPHVKFLHCLPAFHDNKTKIGKKIAKKYNLNNGLEVTNEIFESHYSIVFDQAENRLHTIKSIMLATLISKLEL